MKGRSIPYLPQELAWIEARKEMPRAELHALFCAYWQRDDVSPENFKALCTRRGWKTGRSGCFEKGLVPHNKGKRHRTPGSEKGWFKKGDVPANVVPLWTERVGKDGYVEIKVPERNPHTGHSTRFVEKHAWLWERENGPVPEGHALKCLDGNKQNTDPRNWTPVPRALLPRLAGGRHGATMHYDTAPDELKPTLLAIAKLEHLARERRKESA